VENVEPGTITTDPAWDGLTNVRVVTGQTIGGGVSHTYEAEIVAQVPTTTTDASTRDCELDEGEEGSGFLNEATVTQGSALLDDDACALSSGIENPDPDDPGDPGDPSAPIDRIDRAGGTSGYGRLASTGTAVAVLVLLGIGLVGIGGRMVRLGRSRHEERP
jgi:hypothetical protein